MINCLEQIALRTQIQSEGRMKHPRLPCSNSRRNRIHRRRGGPLRIFPDLCLCLFLYLGLTQCSSALDESPSSPPMLEQPSFQPSEQNFSSSPSTSSPTGRPTTTYLPSFAPSFSFSPTKFPSEFPTPEPTFDDPIIARARFRQRFLVENGREFLTSEIGFIESLYIGSTAAFAIGDTDVELKVETKCNVTAQAGGPEPTQPDDNTRYKIRRRVLQQYEYVDVDYEMTYKSIYINVTDYPRSFQQYVNSNNDTIVKKMNTLGLNVSEAQPARRVVIKTAEPTLGPVPTIVPTAAPSMTSFPSSLPSSAPIGFRTLRPSTSQSFLPTIAEPSLKNDGNGPSTETIVIVVSAIVAGFIIFIGLLIHYRKREFEREQALQSDPAGRSPEGIWTQGAQSKHNSTTATPPGPASKNEKKQSHSTNQDGMVSLGGSVRSNESLLSAGGSIGGDDSGDEADATHGLADEFDQYKDQNLEKMRADVEGNLTGFDSMMSQALTRALIDEDDDNIDATELLWGGSGRLSGAEIEASALGEVTDWMKRKENATIEEKRGFMQDTLNKMVSSVRQGVLGPDDASRTIHECAALLGLQLATDIPVTTLIVTGMRKTVSAQDMIDAFGEFGQISEAAVAPNKRDFGILRFRANQSVRLAMEKLRVGEIVVQDVAVHVRALKPDSLSPGESDTKNDDINPNS